jgi:hypothetical protein
MTASATRIAMPRPRAALMLAAALLAAVLCPAPCAAQSVSPCQRPPRLPPPAPTRSPPKRHGLEAARVRYRAKSSDHSVRRGPLERRGAGQHVKRARSSVGPTTAQTQTKADRTPAARRGPSGARRPARGERQAPRDLHLLHSTAHLRHGDTAPGSGHSLRATTRAPRQRPRLCTGSRLSNAALSFPGPVQARRKVEAVAGANRVRLPRARLECRRPTRKRRGARSSKASEQRHACPPPSRGGLKVDKLTSVGFKLVRSAAEATSVCLNFLQVSAFGEHQATRFQSGGFAS